MKKLLVYVSFLAVSSMMFAANGTKQVQPAATTPAVASVAAPVSVSTQTIASWKSAASTRYNKALEILASKQEVFEKWIQANPKRALLYTVAATVVAVKVLEMMFASNDEIENYDFTVIEDDEDIA